MCHVLCETQNMEIKYSKTEQKVLESTSCGVSVCLDKKYVMYNKIYQEQHRTARVMHFIYHNVEFSNISL